MLSDIQKLYENDKSIDFFLNHALLTALCPVKGSETWRVQAPLNVTGLCIYSR